MAKQPIGIFDSGVGGLSVMRHIRARLPHEHLIYVADQAHVPYGSRSLAEIRRLCRAVSRFLLVHQTKLIVVACNTASGAALVNLRQAFPEVPFVGMEPAVKPAAGVTRSAKVGVLATIGTFHSQRYAALMARHAQTVVLFEEPCFGLVEQIEAGAIDTPETRKLLEECLAPMLIAGVDTLVLGCTHYPFVQPLIQSITKNAITIIDPAPAVARQTERVLRESRLLSPQACEGDILAFTTGDPERFSHLARRLTNMELVVRRALWRDGDVLPA